MNLATNNLKNDYLCIEYPGIIQNVDKMMKTIGGIDEIDKVVSEPNRRLELKFRPEDKYCKPAYGEKSDDCSIILKIKIRRKKIQSEQSQDPPKIISIDIVGKVNKVIRFKALCDFQYLPMERDESGKMLCLHDTFMPLNFNNNSIEKWLDESTLPFFPPSNFSRIDSLGKNSYLYRRDKAAPPSKFIGRTRKSRSNQGYFVSFDEKTIPVKPLDKCLKLCQIKFPGGEHLNKVKKLFEERPIWSKLALLSVTKLEGDKLKIILPAVAYYFITGPFRVMWVRLGYDPKTDPNSKIYQTLDFRPKSIAGLNYIESKRRYSNYITPNKSVHSAVKKIIVNDERYCSEPQEPSTSLRKVQVENPHLFTMTSIPSCRQMFYQYCDVKVPEIEEMLAKLPKIPPAGGCHPKNGWLPPGFDQQCRVILNRIILDLLKKFQGDTKNDDADDIVEDIADDSSEGVQEWQEDYFDEIEENSDDDNENRE